ncbi:MAG: hypothetical protein PHO55_15110, partial [Thiomonas arsenitoxydans]|nr:hypothetical protein [Thiomonas arsenitoxydans]
MGWNPFRRSEPQAAISEGLLTALLMGEASATRSTFVTPDTALTSTAVLACLIVRAETIGSLPAHVYRRDGDSR